MIRSWRISAPIRVETHMRRHWKLYLLALGFLLDGTSNQQGDIVGGYNIARVFHGSLLSRTSGLAVHLAICPKLNTELLQLGVFRLGLLEDRDAGVSVFPADEKIPVGSLCLS